MSRILLISESYFRDRIYVSDSINSKLVTTSIQEVQDFALATIIGDRLLHELYTQVEAGTLTELNKTLLDTYIQPLLLYKTAESVIIKSPTHISNNGNTQSAENADAHKQFDYYRNQGGIALERLTKYLTKNYSKYPLLSGSVLDGIRAHVNASLETSIYLGGSRKGIKGLPVDPGILR